MPAAADLLPSLGGQPALSAGRLLSVVDGLVMAIASQRPTMLVMNDVQGYCSHEQYLSTAKNPNGYRCLSATGIRLEYDVPKAG